MIILLYCCKDHFTNGFKESVSDEPYSKED